MSEHTNIPAESPDEDPAAVAAKPRLGESITGAFKDAFHTAGAAIKGGMAHIDALPKSRVAPCAFVVGMVGIVVGVNAMFLLTPGQPEMPFQRCDSADMANFSRLHRSFSGVGYQACMGGVYTDINGKNLSPGNFSSEYTGTGGNRAYVLTRSYLSNEGVKTTLTVREEIVGH